MFIPNVGPGRTTGLQKTDQFSILIKMVSFFFILFIFLFYFIRYMCSLHWSEPKAFQNNFFFFFQFFFFSHKEQDSSLLL